MFLIITGDRLSDSIEFLDRLVFELIKKSEKSPEIFVHVWYKDDCEINWSTNEKGKYRILAFVKDKAGKTECETSDYYYL